jgi:phosphohistidine phosphatase
MKICDLKSNKDSEVTREKMKTLYIFRHAKSSWKNPDLTDFERPLNKRGKLNAPHMGRILREKGVKPNLFISSPAKRALKTAKLVANELDYPEKKIKKDDRIYDNYLNSILRVIKEIDDQVLKLIIFGHNPAFTELAEYLSGEEVDNVPTSGIVAIEFEIESWSEIAENKGRLLFFEYPKKYE